jgi:hypothetical protein
MVDFNDASPQRSFKTIPAGTVADLHLKVRPGNAGEGGWLSRSKDGTSEALDCEFVVVDGPFAKRKFWARLLIGGTTEGHAHAADITRSRLRAILESARGIRPDDMSDAAKQARQISSYRDLDDLRFIGRIGIEPARDNYPAKNTLLAAVTPDQQDWHRVEQVATHGGAAAPANKRTVAASTAKATVGPAKSEPVKIEKPEWAKKAS